MAAAVSGRNHVQVDSVLTATGKKVLGETYASGGASLEVGGAHWFAEAREEEEEPMEEHDHIDGSIAVAVRLCVALENYCSFPKAMIQTVVHTCSTSKDDSN